MFNAIFIISFAFFSVNSIASIITWDFEFEVSYVEDRTNGAWINAVVVGDILSASLSFDSDTPVLIDNTSVTSFDVNSASLDIASLTSDMWLNNLSPLAAISHWSSRELGSILSGYSVDNTQIGDINWEVLNFDFRDYNASAPYTSFPNDWGNFPVSFTYRRDLDANNSDSEILVTGNAISATQRVQVPEPASIALFALFLVFIIIPKYMKKHKKSHEI